MQIKRVRLTCTKISCENLVKHIANTLKMHEWQVALQQYAGKYRDVGVNPYF